MPRPSRPWFRFYVEAVWDRKLRRLSPAQRWLWVAMLAAARQSPRPGYLLIAEGEPMTANELADYAGVPVGATQDALTLMARLGMVEENEGCWVLPNWSDRQFESDDVNARSQRFRQRRSNVASNDIATHQRTETDTDTPQTPQGGLVDNSGQFHPSGCGCSLCDYEGDELAARRKA